MCGTVETELYLQITYICGYLLYYIFLFCNIYGVLSMKKCNVSILSYLIYYVICFGLRCCNKLLLSSAILSIFIVSIQFLPACYSLCPELVII